MMSCRCLALLMVTAALTSWPADAPAGQKNQPTERLDQYGDPLPEGAICRFGSIRLRGYANRFAFAPNGKSFASGGDDIDPTIRIWDVATGKEVRHWAGHTFKVLCLAYLGGGEKLASVSTDGDYCIWEVASGKKLHSITTGKRLATAALSVDGQKLIRLALDDKVYVTNTSNGLTKNTIFRVNILTAFSLPSDGVALVGRNGDVEILDSPESVEPRIIATKVSNLAQRNNAVVFSADGKRLAVATPDGEIIEWDTETTKEIGRYKGLTGVVSQLAYSPDSRRFVAYGGKGVIHVWGVASHQRVRELDVGSWGIKNPALSADGKLLVAVQGAVIRLWDLWANKEVAVYSGCTSRVTDLAFTADSSAILSCEFNGIVRRFTASSGTQTASWAHPAPGNFNMTALPDGTGVLSPSQQGITRIDFDATTSTARTLISQPKVRIQSKAVAANGKILATTGNESTIKFWDSQTGKAKGMVDGVKQPFKGYAFSPDGALFAACRLQMPLSVWDVSAGKLIRQVDLKNDIRLDNGRSVNSSGADVVMFAPDGESLVTMAPQAQLWETATGGRRALLHLGKMPGEFFHYAISGAFSPDGRLLMLGTSECAVLAIDTATGKELGRLEGHHGYVASLAFAPNGKMVASGGEDGSVVVWDVTALVEKARPAPVKLEPERLRQLWRRPRRQRRRNCLCGTLHPGGRGPTIGPVHQDAPARRRCSPAAAHRQADSGSRRSQIRRP